jgi:hypothetical protein
MRFLRGYAVALRSNKIDLDMFTAFNRARATFVRSYGREPDWTRVMFQGSVSAQKVTFEIAEEA